MNLDDEDLCILLHIEQGRKLDLKNGNVMLTATATLGGNSLEAKHLSTSDKIELNNNLRTKENDKKSVKGVLISEKCSTNTTKDNIPRTFGFNLILETIKFNRRPETGIWQISLFHPNADKPHTISNVELTEISSNLIEFENLELQLIFSSNLDNIFEVVSSDSCVLKINGPRGINAFAELGNEVLLASAKGKRSGLIVMENQNGEKCAMAHISLYLEDLGISFNSQVKKPININNNISSRAYMDEHLAYEMMESLEDWKQKQQENFLVELKRKEINHLAILSLEWQKRRNEFENELTSKLDHCNQLSDTLEEAHRALKEKSMDHFEHKKLAEKVLEDVEYKFSKIITELNEKIEKIEIDNEHKIKLEHLKYKELELVKLNVEKEKISLQKELDDLRMNYLPKEQLVGLFEDVKMLNERLELVQKSKQYYKEQWAKLIREIHKMKSPNLNKVNEDILYCKCTGLQNLLQNEKNEFYSEREELNEIKAALNNSDDESDCESFYKFDQ